MDIDVSMDDYSELDMVMQLYQTSIIILHIIDVTVDLCCISCRMTTNYIDLNMEMRTDVMRSLTALTNEKLRKEVGNIME